MAFDDDLVEVLSLGLVDSKELAQGMSCRISLILIVTLISMRTGCSHRACSVSRHWNSRRYGITYGVPKPPHEVRGEGQQCGSRLGCPSASDPEPVRLSEGAFFRLLPDVSFVGEVGLDFSSQGMSSRKTQIAIFERLLSDPNASHVPMTVHTRAAATSAIPMLKSAGSKPVLHWYTGQAI